MVTVVTGASGFLGGALVRALLADGRQVRAVDLQRSPGLAGLDVDFIRADVLDPTSLAGALEAAEVVYHLAAVISVTGDRTGTVWAINVDGVRNVAEAALAGGVGRLVHCSSVHAYDLEGRDRRIDETGRRATDAGLPVYDRSKAAGEEALREVVGRGLDAVIVNPTAVIGPYDFGPSRMGKVFLTLFRRRLPALIAGGFDWVDVRDVAASMMAAEDNGRTGENYLLPGHSLSLRDLAAVAEIVSGVHKPTFTVPMWFARVWSPLANVVSRRSHNPLWYTSESLHALRFPPIVSGAKAGAELAHAPRPIEETVADIHQFFMEQGMIYA